MFVCAVKWLFGYFIWSERERKPKAKCYLLQMAAYCKNTNCIKSTEQEEEEEVSFSSTGYKEGYVWIIQEAKEPDRQLSTKAETRKSVTVRNVM